MLFLGQMHLKVSQVPLQEHLMIFRISCGAGGKSVVIGNNISFFNSPPTKEDQLQNYLTNSKPKKEN